MILLWNFRFLCERLRFRTARRRVELFSHHEINRICHNGLVPQAAAHWILLRHDFASVWAKYGTDWQNLARMLYISVCFFFGSRRKVRKFAQYGNAYCIPVHWILPIFIHARDCRRDSSQNYQFIIFFLVTRFKIYSILSFEFAENPK